MQIYRNRNQLKVRLFLLFVLLILQQGIYPQTFEYFNNRYDISGDGSYDDCSAIVETNEGFVVSGSALMISGNYSWWQKRLTKLDQFGMVQYTKTYSEDSVHYFFSYYSGYILRDNNYFYAVGKKRTPGSNGLHDEGTLMYLDESLDTIWMKRFGETNEPFDTAFNFSCIQKINQKDLIISGGWKPYGMAIHAYLLKVDSSGNKIWDRSYSYSNYYIEGTSVAQSTDSGFIIGCFKQTPGYPYSVDPVLIKTDSLGNQEWTKNLGGPYKDSSPFVAIDLDDNIIVGTSYGDTMATPDNPMSRINLVKLDYAGNIIWNRKYGESERSKYLHYIRILDDGCIISVGSVVRYNPEPDRVSWILKTNSDGDSILYREYIILTSQQSRNYLYDVIETSDNGLIACGYVDPYPPDTGSADTWVIKLDSIGCEWAGCDTTVGVEEIGGEEAWGHGGLEVWPNPASGEIHVRLNMDDGRFYKDLDFRIYDILGKITLASLLEEERAGDHNWTIDVSSLPSGIYLLLAKNGGSVIGSTKFIVSKP